MKLITIPTLLAASLAISGCNKKAQKATTVVSKQPDRSPRAPSPAKREVANDDLREALLQLQRVHFGLDTATLLPEARDSLERAAQRLAKYPDVHLNVDGHTDDRGTTEYNIALGERRAVAVIDYLERLGIPRSRLHAVSFGEQKPRLEGEGSEERAANRRVEFRLMRGNVQLVLDDGVPYSDDGAPLEVARRSGR